MFSKFLSSVLVLSFSFNLVSLSEGISVLMSKADIQEVDPASRARATLLDIDWEAHVVVASDVAVASEVPRLSLALRIGNADGSKKDLIMELSKDELDKLISQLERADAAVSDLTV